MNDIYVTLTGNVTHDPRQFPLPDGSRVTSIRVATSRRYLDRRTQEWMSSPPSFYSVRCYRSLADNVAQSIRRGQPVVVHGRLRIREFERDGERRFLAEIEASSVGHDLKWGIATFEKPLRAVRAPAAEHERAAFDDGMEDWAEDGHALVAGHPGDHAAGGTGVAADAPWQGEARRVDEEGLAA
jgi:single stranded DNA-binding protein (ssb)